MSHQRDHDDSFDDADRRPVPRLTPPTPVEPNQARRVMLDYVGARARMSTTDELLATYDDLCGTIERSRGRRADAVLKLVKAFADLVYVEAQLRDAELEAHLRDLLASRRAE